MLDLGQGLKKCQISKNYRRTVLEDLYTSMLTANKYYNTHLFLIIYVHLL